MIRVVNESDNYTDFSMLEEGDVFYWTKYDGYFMKIRGLGIVSMATATASDSTSCDMRCNAINLTDGHLYFVRDDTEIIKAQSAKLTVDM